MMLGGSLACKRLKASARQYDPCIPDYRVQLAIITTKTTIATKGATVLLPGYVVARLL